MSENLQDKLVAYRRELHEIENYRLKKWKQQNVLENGWQMQELKLKNIHLEVGVVAEIKGELPGPTIALGSILMHFQLKNNSGVPFASKNEGVMHACGHDFHAALIMGAAIF